MPTNLISISNASSTPNRRIDPASGSPKPAGAPYYGGLVNPPTNGDDRIEISANAGEEAIVGYTVISAGGEDTVQFNGSPVDSFIDLGDENDLFSINTLGLGGSLTGSTVLGREGNDIFRILIGNAVTTTTLDGGFGSDLFELQGSFDLVTLTGGGNNDVVRFLNPGLNGSSVFNRSFVGLGAGDDLFEDGGFPLSVDASSFNGGGGSDTISLFSSTAGTGADGVLITGGDGADYLYGAGNSENTILGGSGADFLQAFVGDDSLVGGGGSDTLLLGNGADFADSGSGNDVIWGQEGQNTIRAGVGSDIVIGGVDNDRIAGGEESEPDRDYLVGNAGDDTIDGFSGNDLIYGDGVTAGTAANFAYGQFNVLGRNTVTGDAITGVTNAPITLGALTNYFGAGAGLGPITWTANNAVSTGLASKTSTAPATSPWLNGTETQNGAILADGSSGLLIDLVGEQALANNLRVPSSPALAVPTANGNDNDDLIGNSGNDTIFGGGGEDDISGGLGADVIIGGTGADEVSGGDNADIFVQGNSASFGATAANRGTNWTFDWDGVAPDVITDFEATTNTGAVIDRIAFSSALANSFVQANTETFLVRDLLGSADDLWGNNEVVLFSGTWNAVNGRFITSNDGEDVLVFKANTAAPAGGWPSIPPAALNPMGNQAVVLVGAGDEDFDYRNFYGGAWA